MAKVLLLEMWEIPNGLEVVFYMSELPEFFFFFNSSCGTNLVASKDSTQR